MEDEWEILHKLDENFAPSRNARDFDGIEGDSEGVIRSDYFGLDSQSRLKSLDRDRDEASIESDNPSWVDPDSEPRFAGDAKTPLLGRGPDEFWSDSSSDGSFPRKIEEFDPKPQIGDFDQFLSNHQHFGRFGDEIGAKGEIFGEFELDSSADASKFEQITEQGEKFGDRSMEKGQIFGESEVNSDADAGGDDLENKGGNLKFDGAGEVEESVDSCSSECESPLRAAVGELKSGDAEKKKLTWWKFPWELLKFCAFRVGPVWSVSIAAAVMAFVILGRRLYKTKHKNRSIPLKVSLDDKKVSQFMSRAARLNEAFSVVKRVPMIRASLPPPGGVTPWPAMSLR